MNAQVNFSTDFMEHTDPAALHLEGAIALTHMLQSAIEHAVLDDTQKTKMIDGIFVLLSEATVCLTSEKTNDWTEVTAPIDSSRTGLHCLQCGILHKMCQPNKAIQVAAVHGLCFLLQEANRYLAILVEGCLHGERLAA